MWICTKCKRKFEKTNQMHSCKTMPLEEHFRNKEKAKELFEYLFEKINKEIGKSEIISLPCCIHLFGIYDFLAALPKTDRLEIRLGLDHELKSKRLLQAVKLSGNSYKNCIDLYNIEDINEELLLWISKSYNLKSK